MQSGVSIGTYEKSINVVPGTYVVPERNLPSQELALASVKYLYTDINDVRQRYFRLGFHLREFDKNRYYLCFGYSCLADFASVNLGMDASAISRCISVFEKFCKRNDYHPTMFMQEKYEDFSYSQLVEMASIKDDDLLRQIKPDMSVREIREFKKRKKSDPFCELNQLIKNVSRENEDVSQIATSQKLPDGAICVTDLCDLRGAALYAKIRKAPDLDVKHISLYDSDGKPICKFLTCDILLSDPNQIVLRVVPGDVNKDAWQAQAIPLHQESPC